MCCVEWFAGGVLGTVLETIPDLSPGVAMAKQTITRRQKDVARLVRERKEAYHDKLKARRDAWNVKR